MKACSADEFEQIVASLGGGVPDAGMFQHMSTLTLEIPAAHRLGRMDPFSAEYHQAALDLYLSLRAHPEVDYLPHRDEAPAAAVPEHVFSQLPPWSFRDPGMIGEHFYSWGHILRHLVLPPGGSVLEYGPGSGQILLMLEAFHHALDFQHLLRRLHDRLNPGGRVILCGEPVVPGIFPGVPYPWGPRMDALSVFCMRRFGWMELGFTHDFFMEAARRAGWNATFHPFANCGRAHVYVLEATTSDSRSVSAWETAATGLDEDSPGPAFAGETVAQLKAELAAVHASTSWKVTRPLRTAGNFLARLPLRAGSHRGTAHRVR